jgi:hypothetical protein
MKTPKTELSTLMVSLKDINANANDVLYVKNVENQIYIACEVVNSSLLVGRLPE